MTFLPQLPSLTIIPDKGLPRWQSLRDGPLTINEGDTYQLRLRCLNPILGAAVDFRMTGGTSLANGSNWLRSFDDVLREECNRVGLIFRKLTASTTPAAIGTFNCQFIVGENYKDGDIATFRNTARRNRKDDAPLDANGNPGVRRMNVEFRSIAPASANGTTSGQIPTLDGLPPTITQGYLEVRDTSRSPVGAPKITVSLKQEDLVTASPGVLIRDDIFVLRVVVENSIPGTQIRMFAAGDPKPYDGQYMVDEAFRTEIVRAAAEAGCTCFVPRWTAATALQWFNGGIITIPDNAPQNFSINLRFRVDTDPDMAEYKMLYMFSNIAVEGDISDFETVRNMGDYATGGTYSRGDYVKMLSGRSFIYTDETTTSGHSPPTDETTYNNAYWRQFLPIQFAGGVAQVRFNPIPPRFWELRAQTNGSNITYRIQGPTNMVGDNVDLLSTNPPPGFEAALVQACGPDAPIGYANGVLTARATDKNNSSVSFIIPHAGSGKHSLRIMNPRSGGAASFAAYLVIPDACVFLTPPIMPPQRWTSYGVNLAGGEFGAKYTDTGGQVVYNGGRYYYPSSPQNPPGQQHTKMDYFWQQGVRHIRIPFTWNRVQPQLFGPLYYGDDGPFGQFTNHDMRRIIEATEYWVSLGGDVMLDLHCYMGYAFPTLNAAGKLAGDGEKVKFDSIRVTTEALIDFWVRMAEVFAPLAGKVHFGIANEPSGEGQGARRVADNMQAVVNAVRSRTDALNMISRGTSRFSSCKNFVANGDAAANVLSYDPANNHVIELHMYFDPDNSGQNANCSAPGDNGFELMMPATNWFIENYATTKLRGYVGEMGAATYTIPGAEPCKTIIERAYAGLLAHPEAWYGSATWASGIRQTDHFNLEPVAGFVNQPIVDAPSLVVLRESLLKYQT